jgi:hypothetical protein
MIARSQMSQHARLISLNLSSIVNIVPCQVSERLTSEVKREHEDLFREKSQCFIWVLFLKPPQQRRARQLKGAWIDTSFKFRKHLKEPSKNATLEREENAGEGQGEKALFTLISLKNCLKL